MNTSTPLQIMHAVYKSICLSKTLLLLFFTLFSTSLFAQPNNNCASATALTVGAPCTAGTNVGATLEAGENAGATGTGCWGTAPSHTVWYTFTTGATGIYIVSTDNGGTTDTQIKILSGTCGAFTSVACNEDGGGANAFSAIAGATLAASTTYYIQVDVFGGTTSTFCINVSYSPPITNDCIFSAIDITAQINGITTTNPFDCVPYMYAFGGSGPTNDMVNGNNTPCDPSVDYRDLWFTFTVTATTPDVWIDVYQATGTTPDYVAAIYSGTPGGTCGGTITGLTTVDCSDGGNPGGALDVGVCTTPLHPRINAATLPPGTYYYRVWEKGGGVPPNGTFNLCVESATSIGVTSDACPAAPTIALGCGTTPNVNVNETYTNLSNAGCLGNACNTALNEPQLAVGGAGQIRNNCAGAWLTSVGYANNVMNNSAIYAFNVNASGTCQATVTVKFSNITYGGTNGNVMQVQVMNAPCSGGASAVMAGTTGDPCFEMRPASGTLSNGTYYIIVDGQDGQLMQYDLNLQITYGGVGCTPATAPPAPTAVNGSRCGPGTVALSVTGCSGTANWYAAASGGASLGTGASFTTPSISATTTYYASCTISGCEGVRVPVTATINPIPAAPTPGNNGPVCVGSALNLTSNTIAGATYSWTGPNTFVSSLEDPSVSASATTAMAGTYSVTVTVAGCTSPAGTTTVTVNPIPSAPTPGNNGPVCVGAALNLTSNTIAGATYSWTGPNTFVSSLEDPAVSASATTAMAGTYSVTVTVAGCTSPAGTTTVTVNPIPSAPTPGNNGPVCVGAALNLTSNTIAGATYSWTGPNTFVSSLEDPSVSASATTAMAGTYSVTVTVAGCTSVAGTTSVTVNPIPSAPTPGNNGPVCVGAALNLTSNTIAGATYSWTGPNTFVSSLEDPSVSASATTAMAGTYSVTVTVAGCTSVAGTTSVTVNPIPSAPTPGNNGPVCVGAALNLTSNTIAGATYSWTGPNTFVSSLEDPSVSASATTAMAGTYSVTVTVAGCTSPAGTTTVIVNPIPSAPTPGNNGPVCAGAALNLTSNTIAGATYSWTGPNTFVSSLEDPSVSASATTAMAGTYSVTVTVAGCTSIAGTTSVTVNPIPSAPTPGNNGPVCVGAALNLTSNTIAGATYSWTGPNAFVSSSEDPSVSTSATTGMSGTYSVTATVAGCTSVAGTTSVTVNPIPSAPTPGNNGPVCAGAALNLTSNTIAGATYSWTGPNAFVSSLEDPTVSASATTAMAGTYSVTATVAGCTSIAGTTTVIVNPPVVPTAGSNSPVCIGSPLTLNTAAVAGATYNWTGPNAFASTLQNPVVNASATPAMAGTYSLTITVAGCTSAIGTTSVTINPLPNANAGADKNLTCASPSVTLDGSSTTPGAAFSWGGPGGFTSSSATPSTAVAGTYTLTVTVNGCSSTDQTIVNAAAGAPDANAGAAQTITCTTTTASLNGSSITPGVTFSWAGPGIVSGGATATPTVNAAGSYTLTVTDPGNGCSASNQVVVTANTTPPNSNAGAAQTLNCTALTVSLNGSSTTAGSTFSWAGPGIVSGGTTATPTVNAAGTYTLTVTDPSNGCTAPSTVVVNSNTTTPNSNAGAAQSITCTATSVTLNGSSSTSGATFNWSGPGIVSGGATATPSVNAAGTYTLTVTDPANSCTATSNVIVNSNTVSPNASAGTAQTLTCTATSVTLNGSSTTPGATFNWSGPGIVSGGTTATPSVNAAGTYTITVTDPSNGCTSTSTVAVNSNSAAPNSNAGSSVTITCSSPSASLNGSSSTAGATFSWTGPGIVSGGTTATPTVNAAGTYTLTVTDPSNGCTAPSTVTVNSNTTAPNANAGSTQTMTCSSPTITLNGSSSTTGATFSWSGPGIVSGGTTATPSVNAAGTYALTVTDPANGCTATSSVVVNSNSSAPNANAGSTQTLTCTTTTAVLNGSSTTTGATYSWSGPGIVSGGNTATPTVNAAGTYTLTVTDPANGCSSPATVTINSNTTSPNSNAGAAQTLTCTATTVTLNGSSTTTGVTYNWSGPGIVSGGNTSSATVNAAGTYTLTVTDPANGCTAAATVVVNANAGVPNSNAGNTQTINCTSGTVTLNGSSSTAGATFSWAGPGIVSGGTTATPTVNAAGTYTLTVTDPSNGCTAPSTVTVNSNTSSPNANSGPAQVLSCSVSSVTLNGSSSTAGATFSWTGPGIVSGGNTATPSVNAAGTYTITVTDPSNGCTASSTVNISSNTTAPDIDAGNAQTITCSSSTVILNGSSATSGATYSWSGAGIVSGGNTATPTVNAAGTYTLTVTDPANSCTATNTVVVNTNTTTPDANAGAAQTITCSSSTVTLNGSSTTTGVTFAWSGPGIVSGGNTSSATVNAAGTYTLTVTDPANGCTGTSTVAVNTAAGVPDANAGTTQTLTCSTTSIVLNGSSATAGVTYSWSGPGIVSGGTTATPTVNAAGTYTLTVTDPANGCTAPSTVAVSADTNIPNSNAGTSQTIDCSASTVTLTGSSTTTGATFSWSGPGIVSGGNTSSATVNAAGTYTLTVTDPANGCTAPSTVVVNSNTTTPNSNAGAAQTIDCSSLTVTLSGSSTTTGATYSWSGPGIISGGTTASPTVNATGTYTLTVTDPANGCSAPSTVVVNSNTTTPNSDAGAVQTLTCTATSVTLNGSSSTTGATFSWSGPGIVSGGTTATPTVNAAGTYTLTVTDPANGCTAPSTVVVNAAAGVPNANAGTTQTITCSTTSVTLNGSSTTTGVTYSWSGPGILSGGTTATPTVNAAGTYTLTVTDPSNGCTAPSTVVVNSNTTTPNSNAGPAQTLTCTATSVTLNGSSSTTGATFSWSGPGIVSGGTTASATVNAAGTYTLTVTDPANGCTAPSTVTVSAGAGTPNVNAGTPQTINCSVTSVTLNGSSTTTGATYSWSGPGIVSGGTTPSPTVNAAGTYTLTVTDPSNGCTAPSTVVVNSNTTTPNSNAGSPQTLTCTATSVTLNGSSSTTGAAFSWTGPGIVSGGTTATPSVNAAGTYTLTVTDPSNGCNATSTVAVNTAAGVPNANAGTTQTLTCSTTSVVLNGSSTTSGATYNWSGPGIVSGGTTATPTVNAAGTYTLTVTNPSNGCTAASSVTVNNSTTAPNANAGSNQTMACSSSSATLSGSSTTPGASYNWSGSGIVSGGNTSTATVNTTGTYTLTVTNPSNGCTSTSTVTVSPAAPITVNAGSDITVTLGSSAALDATGAASYNWTPATGLSCTNCPNPVVTPTETTTYCVTGTDGSCTDNDCVTIEVKVPCVTNKDLGVPNAFSPNNDGNNDEFCLQGWSECMKGFNILIFDRWGEKVFESSESNFCWNGTFRGRTLDPAVFVYIINATFTTGESTVKKGNISIIR